MHWFTGDPDLDRPKPHRDASNSPAFGYPDRDLHRLAFRAATGAPTRPASGRRAPGSRHADPDSSTDARARIPDKAGPSAFRLEGFRRHAGFRAGADIPLMLFVSDALGLVLLGLLMPLGRSNSVVFATVVLAARTIVHHYRPRIALTVLDDLPRLLGSTLAAAGVTLVVLAGVAGRHVDDVDLLQQTIAFLVLSLVLQTVVLMAGRRLRRRGRGRRRTLVVGDGRIATTLTNALTAHPELGLAPVTAAGPFGPSDVARLPQVIIEHGVDTAVLALSDAEPHVDTIIDVHQTGCRILLVPPIFEMHHDGPDVERVRGIPLIRLRPDPTLRLSWWVKRAFDTGFAVTGLLLLAPVLSLVAVAVLIDSGRPVMFWQERVGLDGRTFRLCKFRSMRPRSEIESQTQWNIAGDPRVSRLGRLLRRSSVDEIPQLWNILRGQMSLVGPRPERPTFVERFTQEHERYWARHRVPVGLTGLAQVNGLRGDTSIRERARYDNYYIANWSLWLDIKILLLTAREVVGGRGR